MNDDWDKGDNDEIMFNFHHEEEGDYVRPAARGPYTEDTRRLLTGWFEANGIRRPAHAMRNSRAATNR